MISQFGNSPQIPLRQASCGIPTTCHSDDNPESISTCFKKGSEHTKKINSNRNLKDIVKLSIEMNTNQMNSSHKIEAISSKDLRDLKIGDAPKRQKNKNYKQTQGQPSTQSELDLYNKDYKLIYPSAYGSDTRFRTFNNELFSHITDLKSDSPGSPQLSLKERAEILKEQIKFSAQFRPLSFKLNLLAYQNKNAIIKKDQTLVQGAYYGNDISRSGNQQDFYKIKDKTVEEAHISCIPNYKDNLKLNVDNIFILLTDPTLIDQNTLEATPELSNVLNTNFRHLSNSSKAALEKAIILYNCEKNNHDLYMEKIQDGSFWNLFGSKTSLQNCKQFLINIDVYLKTSPEPDLINFKQSFDSKYSEITNLEKDLAAKDLELRNLKKSSPGASKDEKKVIFEQSKLLGKEFLDLKKQIEEKRIESYQELYNILQNNFGIFKNYLSTRYSGELPEMELLQNWTASNESPEEKLKNSIIENCPQESIIPMNSILGIINNATLAMPGEINGGVDTAADKTHHIVPNLLTKFSKKTNSDARMTKYMNKYTEILKNAYSTYASNKGNNDRDLEDIINNLDENSNQTLHDFIVENEGAIAKYFEKHCDYNPDFEKKVLGEVITESTQLLTPITHLDLCTDCWKKV